MTTAPLAGLGERMKTGLFYTASISYTSNEMLTVGESSPLPTDPETRSSQLQPSFIQTKRPQRNARERPSTGI